MLVLGAEGMLGRDLVSSVPDAMALVGVPTGRVELTDAAAIHAALDLTAPDCVVNAAAYTAVDRAEDEPETHSRDAA